MDTRSTGSRVQFWSQSTVDTHVGPRFLEIIRDGMNFTLKDAAGHLKLKQEQTEQTSSGFGALEHQNIVCQPCKEGKFHLICTD